ncbi:hypothetical protein PR001_g24736 [Phytophthora rubi]|uniref:Uncharacterized protein n=1 Tax=Phytophthora rubi TaxID=129364 RepID=A0A6A3IEL3_9STRA|nr:hypothetical protein PR001_g24736 [Phytophthora rubi]
MLLIGLPLALLITTMVEPCDEGAIHAAGRAAAGVAAPILANPCRESVHGAADRVALCLLPPR